MESEIHEYLMSLAGTAWDYKAEWGWERYLVGGKMYAATMKPSDVFAPEYANHPLLNLKCDPLEAEFLREQYADILPGFYSDKRHWISIRLDGEVPHGLIFKLCDASYRLVCARLPVKVRCAIEDSAKSC